MTKSPSIGYGTLVIFLAAVSGASGCLKKEDESTATITTEETTQTTDPTLASLVGTWSSACAATSNVNGSAAYVRKSVTFNSDSTFSYVIAYYTGASCTGNLIWMHSPGTFAVGSATTSPASGNLLRFTLGSDVAIYSNSAAGAAHLNTNCGWGGTFSSNGGLSPGGDWTCTGDSRFTLKGPGTIADLAVVVSGSTASTTSMSLNLPGVQNGSTVDSTTSLTFTK